jgi:hypothetical protein
MISSGIWILAQKQEPKKIMEVEFGFEFHQSKKSLYWFSRDGSYPIRNNRIRVENKRPDPKPLHVEDFSYVGLIFLASFCSSRQQQWERQCYNNSPTDVNSICCSIAQPCRSVCHRVCLAFVCPELFKVVQSSFPYFLRLTSLIFFSLGSISSIYPRSVSTCFYVLFLFLYHYFISLTIYYRTNLFVFYWSTLMFPLLIWTCTCSPIRLLYSNTVLGIRVLFLYGFGCRSGRPKNIRI